MPDEEGRAKLVRLYAKGMGLTDDLVQAIVQRTENVSAAGKDWMIIAPGTKSNVASAISHMLRRLPADQEWFSYRKVV